MTAYDYELQALGSRRPLTVADLPEEDSSTSRELISGSLYVTPGADPDHQLLVADVYDHLYARLPADSGLRLVPGINIVVDDSTLVIRTSR